MTVFDLVHGDDRRKKEAEAQLKKFASENKDEIESNRAQCVGALLAGDQDAAASSHSAMAIDGPMYPALPFNPAAMKPVKYNAMKEEMFSDPTSRACVQMVGGYDIGVGLRRCQAEAWNSMWYGC